MKQLALDIGLQTGPTLASFIPGANVAALEHLQLWVGPGAQT
ncbi:MAG: DnaA regulatory inactivator Hda, partial [Comamonadaceae bacterium]